MYSQGRTNSNTLGESGDAQFNHEWRQHNPKMCDEEYILVSRTERHQNDVKTSFKLQSFNYPYSPTSLDRGIEKGSITNGYENVCHSGDNGSTDSSGGNNGPVSDNNYYISLEFSGDIYENDGDTFRTHSEFDKSSMVLERSDDVLSDNIHQLWTDNITGGTSRKEYIDMNLHRPNFQHDSSNSLQKARKIGFIENRSVDTETQNLYQNEKRNDKKTNKTGLVVILGILLIACIAGVLAWFLAKKGDDEFSVKYYVVNGEMALKSEFYPALSNSSSKEFKDLALQFCGAITDALGKNDTNFGDLYRHCDVTKFRNGSIIVQYRLYYQYYEIQITKEKVFQDLKNSLTDIDSGLANFSVFVIMKASVSFLVEVQTFKTDPFAIDAHLISSTTITAATEQKTTVSNHFTTKNTTEYPKVSTTLTTSDYPTTSTNTVERFAESTTMNERERSTISRTIHTTESSPTPTNFETSERIRSTTFSATATIIEYSADIVVSPMFGIYGETTTTKTCVVFTRRDWVHVTMTVENQGTSYVIGKYHSNKTFEEPASLKRFDASITSTDTEIVVYLSLDLQAPTTDMCSWNQKYKFLCSITMDDSISTQVYNGSWISITAPISDVTIDSNVHYDEGDKMTINCSVKGDPNYSLAYVELIKNSQILHTLLGPMFGSDYSSNCSVVLNWSGSPPNPLTSQEHDLIVRCVVKNKLLKETIYVEKKLNVSAADVAFTKYSYKALTSSNQEIECIARSPMSILQELIISKDNILIATLNSSGVASSTNGRYSTNIQEYDGEVRLTLSILSVECQDQGRYNCKLMTTNNATRVSPEMSFIVEGSKPTMTLHPDIYEPFARRGLNHVCSTDHIGDENNDNFLEIQIFQPGSQRAFTYSKKIAEVEKMFDSTNNITYINITGTAQFLLVSHTSSSSNQSCNIKETITFLLDLKMDFDNGTIKCVLKEEMEEFSAVESTITVIPGNFCDGYEHGAFRKHPNNDCNDYINCNKIQGKMYAIGNQCPLGQCLQFSLGYCVPCDSTFTCDELTTPGPTTTTTTLPPGRRYVSCNDSAHFLGTTAVIRCIILDTFFTSLNINFLSEHSQNEEYVGEIFPDGQTQSIPQSPIILSTNFDLSPKILMFTFQQLKCSSKGRYRIIAGGTNSSVAASVETFELNVLGNLTGFQIHIEPEYPEGTLVDFNCTASLDESQANIKGYYKKETESGFFEIKGTTTVIERNMSHCFVKVLWKPSTPFAAYTSFNNADLMCELVDWPLVQPTKQIFVQNADVAFETYKLESSIGSQVSVKCLARNTHFIKSILIRKIENPFNTTVANVTFPNMTSHVDGTTVSYTNNSLKLTFSSIKCSDDGQYLCIVIKEDESQLESPAYLLVHLRNPPKHEAVTFTLHPDIKDDKYDTSKLHTCSGDVGYPSGLGYLSLKFTDPTTNASFTYDKLTVTEEMKTSLELPLKFKVSLASGLSIIIVNDDEPDSVNCTRTKEIKFLLQATRDWNKAKSRCRVISETNEVNFTSVEKEIYVIPDAVCDSSNGSDIYVPYEKIDQCRTYIRCFNNKPTGQLCGNALCFDHKKNYCNWCTDVACESEMGSTTESQITTTSSLPGVPEIQCPLLSCKPSSVFEMESGNIVCELNTSMKYDNITVMKNGQAIMTVYPNGTNYYFSDDFDKYNSTVGTSFTFEIKNVSCSDENEYTFTVEVSEKGSCYKTASLEIKAKPGIPTLVIDYTWTEGTDSGSHSCTGSIGNPPGTMTLEIRDGETGNFTKFSPSTKSLTTLKENCHYDATLTFSINFNTDNIQSHYIRCVADSQHTLLISESPLYSREVFVNPLPANACFENGIHTYPGDCTRFLNCYNNITRAIQCPSGLCFENYYCGISCTGCNA